MLFFYAFFAMRISCGLFLSYICCCSVTLVGTKGCKIRGDAHKLWGAPGWCVVCVTIHVSISQLCLLASEAHPGSWRTLGSLTRWTSLLQLLCQSWGCCPREEGCFFIGRGVTATVVVVFTPLRRVLGSERGFERSRSSSAANARRDGGGSCGARAPLLRGKEWDQAEGTQAEKRGHSPCGIRGLSQPKGRAWTLRGCWDPSVPGEKSW